jgi:hypothetical protein
MILDVAIFVVLVGTIGKVLKTRDSNLVVADRLSSCVYYAKSMRNQRLQKLSYYAPGDPGN